MFDAVQQTDPVKRVSAKVGCWPFAVLWQVGELDAVIGEHGVDAVRNGCNERFEEGGSGPHVSLFDEFNHGELRGSVDGNEQVELAFGGSDFGQVDVEEADRIGVELLPPGLVTLDIGQTADAVTFQTPMQGRASELRDRGLERIKTVVERQKRVLAKRYYDGFLFHRQNRRPGNGGASPAICDGVALLPRGYGLWVDAMPPSQRPHTLLTLLYRSTDRRC